MSRRRPPVPIREAVAVLAGRGLNADIDLSGRHFKVSWKANGHKHLLVISRTPGDRRASANARSVLRRLLELPQ
jgi:hypothetical protein